MIDMKKIIITTTLAIGSLFACRSAKVPVNNTSEKSIAGINWYLKKILQASATIDVNDNIAFIKFDAEKNTAGGKGGCNNFGSSYQLNNSSISFKNIYSTKMFCEKYQQQEDHFFRLLGKVNRFDVSDGKLLLYDNNDLLLEFGK